MLEFHGYLYQEFAEQEVELLSSQLIVVSGGLHVMIILTE